MNYPYPNPFPAKKEYVSCKIIVSKWNKKYNEDVCCSYLTYCDEKELDTFAKIASTAKCVFPSHNSKSSYYIQIISNYLSDEPVFIKVKKFPVIVALFTRLMTFDDRSLPTNFNYERHGDFSNFFVANNGDCPLDKNYRPEDYAVRKAYALEKLFNCYCKESNIEFFGRIIDAQSVDAVENINVDQPNQESIPTEIQDIE